MNVIIHVNDSQIVISGADMTKVMLLGSTCFTTKIRHMGTGLSGAYRTVLSEILQNKDIHLDGSLLQTTGVGMALLYKAVNQEISGFDENYDCARSLAYKDLMTGTGVNDQYRNLPSTDRISQVVEDLVRAAYSLEMQFSSQKKAFSEFRAIVQPSIQWTISHMLSEQPKLPDSKFRYSDWGSVRVWYYAVLTHVYLAMMSSSSVSHINHNDDGRCDDVADFWDDILEVTAVDELQFEFLQTARL